MTVDLLAIEQAEKDAIASLIKCPVSHLDPFDPDFLMNPYLHHAELRDAGPLFWLDRYQVWGMARFEEISAALKDWQALSSAVGVGLDDLRKDKPWRPPSRILEVDPPIHTRTRAVIEQNSRTRRHAASA